VKKKEREKARAQSDQRRTIGRKENKNIVDFSPERGDTDVVGIVFVLIRNRRYGEKGPLCS